MTTRAAWPGWPPGPRCGAPARWSARSAAGPAGQAHEPVYPSDSTFVTTDAEMDRIVTELRDIETPPLSYREMAARFRAAGHAAGEVRLRAAWRRVTATTEGAA